MNIAYKITSSGELLQWPHNCKVRESKKKSNAHTHTHTKSFQIFISAEQWRAHFVCHRNLLNSCRNTEWAFGPIKKFDGESFKWICFVVNKKKTKPKKERMKERNIHTHTECELCLPSVHMISKSHSSVEQCSASKHTAAPIHCKASAILENKYWLDAHAQPPKNGSHKHTKTHTHIHRETSKLPNSDRRY